MRYTIRKWVEPEDEWSESCHHLSYILFRTDSEETGVVAARCPDMYYFSVGQNLIDLLSLDEEAQSYLFDSSSESTPLVVRTRVGVGILDKRYESHTGLCVYWHIHGRPEALARLANLGALTDLSVGAYRISSAVRAMKGDLKKTDMPSYHALQDAKSHMNRVSGYWPACDGGGCLYRRDLCDAVERLADFVGCRLVPDLAEDAPARVRCRRPLLLEGILLCLLTEVQTYSASGEAVYRMSTLGGRDGEGLALEFSYPIAKTERHTADLAMLHRYLNRVSDLGGLDLHAEEVPLRYGEGKTGKLPQIRITLEWLHDPAVLATSDLKAKIRFLYDQEEQESGEAHPAE